MKKSIRKMDQKEIIERLMANKCIVNEKEIALPPVGPGIKIWGMIDYLVNKLKYTVGR